METLVLRTPSVELLPSFTEAMERSLNEGSLEGWYAENELRRARTEPEVYLAELTDLEGHGTVTLQDGTTVPRLPGFTKWMWDSEICGTINFRWIHGSTELPPTCLGHIGYEVFGWKRRRGYATQALHQMLELIRPLRIPFVELTTNVDNIASQRVIAKCGGSFVEEFTKEPANGGGLGYRYRINL